jgi:hypothetical protein
MRSYAGFRQPGPIAVPRRVFRRHPILAGQGRTRRDALAISLVVATLIALTIGGNGWKAPAARDKDSSRVTVIYKNRVHPSIGELKARAAETDEANSDKELLFQRQGQWI